MYRYLSNIAYLLAAFLVAGTLVAPVLAHEGHDDLPSKGVVIDGDTLRLSEAALKSIRLKFERVVLRDLERTVSANAAIESPWYQQTILTTLVSGKVEHVSVRPGERVEVGQELARIESLELETLQLQMLRARNEITLARHMLEQRERLSQQGNIAERRLLESRAALQERYAEFAIARRKLRALGLSDATLQQVLDTKKPVRTLPIVAPRRGYLAEANVRAGQFVEPADSLYHIVDLSEVWVHAGILETDSQGIALGQPLRMTVAAIEGETFTGDVHHVDLRVDTEEHTLPVTGIVRDPRQRIKPGMFGRITVVVDERPAAVACPIGAILNSNDGPYVMVLDLPGTLLRRKVQLGLRQDNDVEVLDGLFPGDEVATTGNIFLAALFEKEAAQHAAPATAEKTPTPAPPAPVKSASIVVQGMVELPTFRKLFASSPIAGRVAEILVEHGQPVKKGDILGRVQSLELRTLELDLLLARVRLKLAKQSLDRYQQLDLNGSIAEKDLWQSQTDYNTLRNTVASLEHKLALVGLSADDIAGMEQVDLSSEDAKHEITGIMPVRAPADGWIVDFTLVPGQMIHPNVSLFEIHDLARVEVQGFVYENDAPHLRAGQNVTVTIAADPSYVGHGRVLRTAPVVSTIERVLTVWTELDNPQRQLKDGMLARLSIELSPPPPTAPR
ncbi:MAG: efflux RND transporter periplasmic adaptor subunit [Planctomycetes bacterium]|nr:efflux RND transporter periplasmic adaptor subunit [Planctomycetota bacterium]